MTWAKRFAAMRDVDSVYNRARKDLDHEHEFDRLVRVVKSNGSVGVRKQCRICGAHSQEVSQAGLRFPVSRIPQDDGRVRDEWLRRIQEAEQAIAQDDSRRWFALYDEYLVSPEWDEKRQLVMRRCNGVCEGCMKAFADHVHHQTYARVGEEMLFDLAALCRQCHERFHNHEPKTEGTE